MLGCVSGCMSVCTRPLFSISNQRAPPGWSESSGAVHKSGPAWKDLHRQTGKTIWIRLCQVCALWDRPCSSPLRSWDQTWLRWLFEEGTVWCHWSSHLEPSGDELEAIVTPFHSSSTFYLKTLGTNSDFPLTSLHLPPFLSLSLAVLVLFLLHSLWSPFLFQALIPCWTLPLLLSHIWTGSWGWPGFSAGGGGGRLEQEGGGKLSIAKPRAL